MRCWGKESDFIWKASRPRRWQTRVLKHHLNRGLMSSFSYTEEVGGLRSGGDDQPHTSGRQRGSEEGSETPCPTLVVSRQFAGLGLPAHDVCISFDDPVIIFVQTSLSRQGR